MSGKSDPKKLILNLAERNSTVPEFQFILDGPDNFNVKRVGERGCVNIIYRVQSKDEEHSLIVKHSEEGPCFEGLSEEALGLERQPLEYNCLMTLHNLIPGCVPQPYCLDEQLHIIAMEDLSHMELLGVDVSHGEINSDLFYKLGELIGKVHAMTHKELVTEEIWREYETSLKNEGLRDRIAMYRTHIMCDENHPVVSVSEECHHFYQKCISEIKAKCTMDMIQRLYAREDCFTHADLHLYSLFVSSQRIAMIDFEFGHLGNHSYTPAYFMANSFLLMLEAQSNNRGREMEIEEKIKTSIQSLMDGFFSSFGDKFHVLGPIDKLYTEMAVFCGHALFTIPCMIVVDHVFKLTSQQKKRAMERGYTLLDQYSAVTSLGKLLDMLFPTINT